jgi:hypothetical protein
MKIRTITFHLLALVACLAALAPAVAFGQTGNLILTTDVVIGVPVADQQLLRVTIGNPNRPDPDINGNLQILDLTGVAIDPITIGPGESFTYTLDPREVGVLVDPGTGLRHVKVGGRIGGVAIDPSDPTGPHPAFLIEMLNRRTGKLESFHAYPGFGGGVYVAAGDLN